MSADEAALTAAEQRAFDRILEAFPGTKVGEFEPHTDESRAAYERGLDQHPQGERPAVILPELAPVPMPPQLVDGLSFALDSTAVEEAIWGSGDGVAWAPGEATLIIGPDGVGKTTLAQRLALGLAGISPELLGLRIAPADGMVLYVAADRPKQSARSMWRMLTALEDRRDHGKLRDALLVWKGPLPFDLVKAPSDLTDWVIGFGVSHVILDSLGFIATRLTEDETGSAIAQAFTVASTAGVEVCALGHPRKASGENRKPNTIADVYGSRWITAAAGSVLSLWASPGDPVIEVRHLKQPAGEVGPFLMELDHDTGQVTVAQGTDLVGRLRAAPDGLSAKQAAAFMEGATEKARESKARRRLENLVLRKLAVRREGVPVRGRIHEPDRYYATPPPSLRETPE